MMLDIVKRYIAKNFDLKHNDRIIVALSGGADSVCLTHILLSLGYNCELAHCNFHLRGAESDRDEKFVTDFAKKKNCILHKTDFDTTKYAMENKLSIEMAARDLRYAWFEEIRAKRQAKYIAVAHHSDDSVETFLMNLTRGAGLNGLCGIMPQNGHIIRPLLCVSRAEIRAYLTENKLNFAEDSTNKENIYTRNKFRNEIIPELEKINPATKSNILQTIDYLNEAKDIYQNFVASNTQNVQVKNESFIEINIEKIANTLAPQSLLYEILKNYGFNSVQCRDIFAVKESNGKQFFANQNILTINRGKLIISKKNEHKEIEIAESNTEISYPVQLKIEKTTIDQHFNLEKNPKIGYFDYDKLTFPLKLRSWEKGDSFRPIGMTNKKLLSDFFIDQKMSIPEKENSFVLTSDNEIIWIVGLRPDDRFKITDSTKNILKITKTT